MTIHSPPFAKTILTVDDSASMRQLVSYALREAGYEVIEAVDGQDALDKMNGPRIDMVVTDLNMPNLDGIELIRRVRVLPRHRMIPIIMLTTESHDTQKQAGRAAGASGWIVKPFHTAQLVAVARKFLG